jgi:2-oxoglutarate ferredoxin oxidoreductase subunit beta
MTMSIVEKIDVVNKLTKADFTSDQEIRWCPGCGDYSILASIQKVLPQLDTPKEKFVFVSGIGCSSRLPYYMDTYGFHTLHGRAPTIATGVKIANPDLSVWVITGDGDAMSIGGNHLLHILRRNLDVNILLINNRIYGLTKGQYSPTSEQGKVTKSSPQGSIADPVDPISFAIAAGATFVARAIDIDAKNLQSTLLEAARHKGASFVEIFQNCHIFNDGAFHNVSKRGMKEQLTVNLQHGEPLIYGADVKKAVVLEGLNAKAVTVQGEQLPDNVIVHDATSGNDVYSYMLSRFRNPDLPLPIGVFKKVDKPTYEETLTAQQGQVIQKQGKGDIQGLLIGENSWLQD